MLNGRSKGDFPRSCRGRVASHLHPKSSSPARRSLSNAHFPDPSSHSREFKAFKPIKLSLSPRKQQPNTGDRLKTTEPHPLECKEEEEIQVDKVELFPEKTEMKRGRSGSEADRNRSCGARELPRIDLAAVPLGLNAKESGSHTSSKAQMRTSTETSLSALTPRLFAQIPTKPPSPEAERVYHIFLGLLDVADGGSPPGTFQVAHHKTWRRLSKLVKAPGKVISATKNLAKILKSDTFPHEKWPNLIEDLQICLLAKSLEDEVAAALSSFLQSLVTHVRTHNLERENARRSLGFLDGEDESPRKKLLQSLLNRSVEEKPPLLPTGESQSNPRTEESKSDLSLSSCTRGSLSPQRQNPFPEVVTPIERVDTPPKPLLRKAEQQEMKLNLGRIKAKTPEKRKDAHFSTPKTTPRKRVTAKSSGDLEARTEKKSQFSAMLLSVKLNVFVREKASVQGFEKPNSEEDVRSFVAEFGDWARNKDETVPEEHLQQFLSALDAGKIGKCCEKQQEKDASPLIEATSWVQMSLRRDKAKLSMDFKPMRRK